MIAIYRTRLATRRQEYLNERCEKETCDVICKMSYVGIWLRQSSASLGDVEGSVVMCLALRVQPSSQLPMQY